MSAHRRASEGQALVEFALIFPLIALLVFGFIDVGRAVFTHNTLTNAAREAARVAAVSQIDPASAPWNCIANKPVETPASPNWTFRGCAIAAGATIGVQGADVSISYAAPPSTTLECNSVRNVGCIASVTVVTTFVPITPIAGSIIGSIAMSATSQMPIERTFP
ncbi:MAG: pilus assembly protein [Chloroflexi bacterium]|nr:pilus assembly protein [Chloroflexota bacterium]